VLLAPNDAQSRLDLAENSRHSRGENLFSSMPKPRRNAAATSEARAYQHPQADLAARPEVGTQAHFKQNKPPATYRFDSALAPELVWDGGNPAREEAEALIAAAAGQNDLLQQQLAAFRQLKTDTLPATERRAVQQSVAALEKTVAANRDTLSRLRKMSAPFLNWAGKADRLSFEVATLPLFVHERLSTRAIIDTLKGHKIDKQESFLDSLFGSSERSLVEQTLRSYEHRNHWVNRLVLGDSLVVMNSLLRYEGLGGRVQTIYMDPPYGVKFGSNFQPFIRKRDVKHNEDDDFTREPEMVQAYRDTWELGLHSYLTYLRDRLLLARELLAPSGSIFVQISDENLHHVREVMDEVFGAENFVSQISFQTTTGFATNTLATLGDFLLWYAKDGPQVKVRKLFRHQSAKPGEGNARWIILADGTYRGVSKSEARGETALPVGSKLYNPDNLSSQDPAREPQPFIFEGKTYQPAVNSHWKANYPEGMNRLAAAGRLHVATNSLRFRRYTDDFPYSELGNIWTDTLTGSFTEEKLYVVQTNVRVVERCILMTTDPGDLVLDPTCGSGTTAFVAEQWGRRWITTDTSRVPLALARQRLLTAKFDYYNLTDEKLGPAGGFVYRRRQNTKGEEVGGIVPHVTLKSIANNEPPDEEVLVDRPEIVKGWVRVTGPFTFEATIPTAETPGNQTESPATESNTFQNYVDRMLEVLRRAPVLRLPGNQTVTLKNIRPPAKTLTLSAEAIVDKPTLANLADDADAQPGLTREMDPVAILFGPENGPIGERLVREAWDEAGLKRYTHLYVIGFAIDPKARQFIDSAGKIGIACTYLQATMDLQMGDLLKNMRSSQIFSVCGLPDVALRRRKRAKDHEPELPWELELLGLDTFDPVTMEVNHMKGSEVPAWLLDTDYNGMVFRVRQAFFPRTGAWENLKRALKVEFEESVWDHLAGTVSAPFSEGKHGQIAVKIIDPRGNELMVVKKLEEAK
jgi:adenine-specific DNA-methyltransferase